MNLLERIKEAYANGATYGIARRGLGKHFASICTTSQNPYAPEVLDIVKSIIGLHKERLARIPVPEGRLERIAYAIGNSF